jgi:hypothetical protein
MFRWLGLAKRAIRGQTEIRARKDFLGTDYEVVSGKNRRKLASFSENSLAIREPATGRIFSPVSDQEITREYFAEYMVRVVHQALKDVRDKKPIPENYASNSMFVVESEEKSRVNNATTFPAFIHYGETKISLNDADRLIELGTLTTHFKKFEKHAPLLERALRYRLQQTHGLPIQQIDKIFAADNETITLKPNDSAHTATIIRIQEEFSRAIDQLQFAAEDTPTLGVLLEPAIQARRHLIDSIEINRRGLTHLGTVSLGRIVRQAADDIPESIERLIETARISGNTDKIGAVLTMINQFNQAIKPFLANGVESAAANYIDVQADLTQKVTGPGRKLI